MRVDSVTLAQAMVRAQSTINPASRVLPGRTESVQESARPSGAAATKARRGKKTGSKRKLNWNGVGGEVDVWA